MTQDGLEMTVRYTLEHVQPYAMVALVLPTLTASVVLIMQLEMRMELVYASPVGQARFAKIQVSPVTLHV